ncbi:MAG: hypothetical protein U5L09_08090 [Bacteroidales bacterium]|nr:hypothetical protein [Bacteroidales bacterium]
MELKNTNLNISFLRKEKLITKRYMSERKIRARIQYKEDFLPEGLSSDRIIRKRYLFNKTFFDEKGNIIRTEKYHPDGHLEEYEEHTYDKKGFLTDTKTVMNGEIADHSTFEIAEGKVLKEFVHYLDGTKDTVRYDYDNGNLVRKAYFDYEGVLEKETLFQSSENHTKEVTKDEEGDITEEKEKYYENGNLVKEKYRDAFTGAQFEIVYEYDDEGRECKTTRFDGHGNVAEDLEKQYNDQGKLVFIDDSSNKKKVAYTYDKQGRLVLQEEKLYDDTVVSTIRRTYNSDGLHVSSEVYMNGFDLQMSQHYNVHHEYEFYEK